MKKEQQAGLSALSAEVAALVAEAAPSVVRIDDASRLTASGIVWSHDGLILSTSHGVEQDDNVFVELSDGARHEAEIVGRDPESDVALLRIPASGLAPLPHTGEHDVQTGQLALALARPGNSPLSATLGLVSARIDVQTDGRPEYLVHTDTVLYPGFSGGALVDTQGRLIGMINLSFGRWRGVAVGVPILAHVAQQLLEHGRIPRGYLGVRTQLVALPQDLQQAVKQEYGLLVVEVEATSPAQEAGLLLGDTLLAVHGKPLTDVDELRRHLRPGASIDLKIARAGVPQDLSVVIGEAA